MNSIVIRRIYNKEYVFLIVGLLSLSYLIIAIFKDVLKNKLLYYCVKSIIKIFNLNPI